MKRFTFFVCLAALLLLIPAGVSAIGSGYINVTTVPSTAQIRLDGSIVGNTPYNFSASNGTHALILSLSGYNDYSTSVIIADNSIFIPYTFQNPVPTLSGITPTSGINTTTLSGVTITGTGFPTNGFSTIGGSVVLRLAGHQNITATGVTVTSSTQITCAFPITGAAAGTWDVIVTNPDGQSATLSNGFTLKSQADTPTLTSISPSSAANNSTVSITSLSGTNFIGTSTIKLVNPYYNDIAGTVNSVNTAGTVITGTFDLNKQVPATYQVCVYNSASIYTCGLSFQVLSPGQTTGNSSIYFQSNPDGATVSWKNGTTIGTTTFTYNITPGTYTVVVQKTGYKDYVGTVTAIEGKRVSFYAPLTLIGEDTTQATTAVTTIAMTVTTIKKSTLKVPTSWPSDTPTTEGSPADPLIAVGAAGIGIALVVFRRR